jgi:hypothetical protein
VSERSPHKGIWGRTIGDIRSAVGTLRFLLATLVLDAVAALVTFLVVKEDTDRWMAGALVVAAVVSGTLAVLLSVFVLNLMAAPYRQLNDALQENQRLRTELGSVPDIRVTAWDVTSFEPREPVDAYDATGIFVVVPVDVINRTANPIDLDASLFLRLEETAEFTSMRLKTAENVQVPEVEQHLNRWEKAGGQLTYPLRIGQKSRKKGYLVFLIDARMTRHLEDKTLKRQVTETALTLTDTISGHPMELDVPGVYPRITFE